MKIISILTLLLLASCGPKVHPPLVYKNCVANSGLIMVAQTPQGPKGIVGQTGCRCFVEINKTILITADTVTNNKCKANSNATRTYDVPPETGPTL